MAMASKAGRPAHGLLQRAGKAAISDDLAANLGSAEADDPLLAPDGDTDPYTTLAEAVRHLGDVEEDTQAAPTRVIIPIPDEVFSAREGVDVAVPAERRAQADAEVMDAAAFSLGIGAGLGFARVASMARSGLVDEDDWRAEVRAMKDFTGAGSGAHDADSKDGTPAISERTATALLGQASGLMARLLTGVSSSAGAGAAAAAASNAPRAPSGPGGHAMPPRALAARPAPTRHAAPASLRDQDAEMASIAVSALSRGPVRPSSRVVPSRETRGPSKPPASAMTPDQVKSAHAAASASVEATGSIQWAFADAVDLASAPAVAAGGPSSFSARAFVPVSAATGSLSARSSGKRAAEAAGLGAEARNVARAADVLTALAVHALEGPVTPGMLHDVEAGCARSASSSTAGRRTFVMDSLAAGADGEASDPRLSAAAALLAKHGPLLLPGPLVAAVLRFASTRVCSSPEAAARALAMARDVVVGAADAGWAFELGKQLDTAIAAGDAATAAAVLGSEPDPASWLPLTTVLGAPRTACSARDASAHASLPVVLPRLAALARLAAAAPRKAAGALLSALIAQLEGTSASAAALLAVPGGSALLHGVLSAGCGPQAIASLLESWAGAPRDAPAGNVLTALALSSPRRGDATDAPRLLAAWIAHQAAVAGVSGSAAKSPPAPAALFFDGPVAAAEAAPKEGVKLVVAPGALQPRRSQADEDEDDDEDEDEDEDEDVLTEMGSAEPAMLKPPAKQPAAPAAPAPGGASSRKAAEPVAATATESRSAGRRGRTEAGGWAAAAPAGARPATVRSWQPLVWGRDEALPDAEESALRPSGSRRARVAVTELLAGLESALRADGAEAAVALCATLVVRASDSAQAAGCSELASQLLAGAASALAPFPRAAVSSVLVGYAARAAHAAAAAKTRVAPFASDVAPWEPFLAGAVSRAISAAAGINAKAWPHVVTAARTVALCAGDRNVAATVVANAAAAPATEAEATVRSLCQALGASAVAQALRLPTSGALASMVAASPAAACLLEEAADADASRTAALAEVQQVMRTELAVEASTGTSPSCAALVAVQCSQLEPAFAPVGMDEAQARRVVEAARALIGGSSEDLLRLASLASRVRGLVRSEAASEAAGSFGWRELTATALGGASDLTDAQCDAVLDAMRHSGSIIAGPRAAAAAAALAASAAGNPADGSEW